MFRIEKFEIWTFFSHNYSAIQYQVTQKRHGWYKDLQNNFSANVKGLLSYFTHFCECQTTEPSHGQALCPGLHWTPLKQWLTWEHPSAIIPSLQYDFYILSDNNIRVSLLKWSRGSHLYFHYSWIKELQVELRAEIWALFYTSASDLKFGSSGRSTWTSYTLFDALGLLILIISALDQFRDVVSWNGTSHKRTVEIGAVALWYQFLLEKLS